MEISLTHALLVIVASLLLLLYFLSSSPRKHPNVHGHSRSRSIPSPPALPVIGHLHLLKKPLHRSLAALAARYGGGRDGAGVLSLRFGARPVILVSSPAIAEECFTVHDVALADRPGLASRRLLTDECPSIALSNYGPLWRDLRRMVTVHALSAHRLSLTSQVRATEVRAMAGRLYWLAGAGAGAVPVSVRATAYEFVVNVIMAMVSGRRMAEEDVRWFMALTEVGLAAAGSANRQDFLPMLRWVDFGRTRRRLAGIAKERRDFGQRLIDEYRRLHPGGEETSSAPRTLLGDVLRQQERSPESYPEVVIRTLCMSMLQAGSDTSSSAIEWAMTLLLNNSDVLAKAKAEIDVVVGTTRLIQESDLEVLPYLKCIITETLRLYPLAPNLVPHEASHNCTVADGRFIIPRGTMVLVDVYSMQRDPASWDDPNMFIPERSVAGNDFGGHSEKRMMMPFRMGRRKCPGEGLAWRTVGVALAVMLQCFEWGRVGENMVNMSEGSGLTMHMSVPLVAMCRPCQDMDVVLKSL